MRHTPERGGPDDNSVDHCEICDQLSYDLTDGLCYQCYLDICEKEIEDIPSDLKPVTEERAEKFVKKFIKPNKPNQ